MCCSRLAASTGRENVVKNRYLGTIEQLRRAISSQLRHISTIGKKLVKQQYLHMSLQYGELRPTINKWNEPYLPTYLFYYYANNATHKNAPKLQNFTALLAVLMSRSADCIEGWVRPLRIMLSYMVKFSYRFYAGVMLQHYAHKLDE